MVPIDVSRFSFVLWTFANDSFFPLAGHQQSKRVDTKALPILCTFTIPSRLFCSTHELSCVYLLLVDETLRIFSMAFDEALAISYFFFCSRRKKHGKLQRERDRARTLLYCGCCMQTSYAETFHTLIYFQISMRLPHEPSLHIV